MLFFLEMPNQKISLIINKNRDYVSKTVSEQHSHSISFIYINVYTLMKIFIPCYHQKSMGLIKREARRCPFINKDWIGLGRGFLTGAWVSYREKIKLAFHFASS